MTDTGAVSQDQSARNPAGIPAERPAVLAPLTALVGEWQMEATFDAGFLGPGTPAVTGRGRTTFDWVEGEFFLLQRFTAEHPDAPGGIAVIGADTAAGTLTQHYYDSRGVERVYGMSIEGGVWKLWRDAPGFCQRFAGTLSGDGGTIEGAWEASPDGAQWTHDFRLTYRKLR
jgi:hypothetical protein